MQKKSVLSISLILVLMLSAFPVLAQESDDDEILPTSGFSYFFRVAFPEQLNLLFSSSEERDELRLQYAERRLQEYEAIADEADQETLSEIERRRADLLREIDDEDEEVQERIEKHEQIATQIRFKEELINEIESAAQSSEAEISEEEIDEVERLIEAIDRNIDAHQASISGSESLNCEQTGYYCAESSYACYNQGGDVVPGSSCANPSKRCCTVYVPPVEEDEQEDSDSDESDSDSDSEDESSGENPGGGEPLPDSDSDESDSDSEDDDDTENRYSRYNDDSRTSILTGLRERREQRRERIRALLSGSRDRTGSSGSDNDSDESDSGSEDDDSSSSNSGRGRIGSRIGSGSLGGGFTGGFFGGGSGSTNSDQPQQPSSGPGGSDYAHDSVTSTQYSTSGGSSSGGGLLGGGGTYWIFEPADPKPETAPIILFSHGLGAVAPFYYQPWIDHLVKQGNIVIYPVSGFDFNAFVSNNVESTKAAISELQTGDHVRPELDKFAVTGHSMGGFVTPNIAALAQEEGLPKPKAIMPVQPAPQMGGASDLSKVPGDTLMVVVVGDSDNIVGNGGGLEIFRETPQVQNKNYVVFNSDSHGSPPLRATHFSPTSLQTDAFHYYGYWKLFDALRDCAFENQNCEYALGNTPEQRNMGEWADGTKVEELTVLEDVSGVSSSGGFTGSGQGSGFDISSFSN